VPDSNTQASASHGRAPSAGSTLRSEQLVRRFGERTALAGVSFDVGAGESFGLLGANGAGKTTFIRLVTGYLNPSAGSVRVDGLSPSHDPRAVQARIGFVPESSRLYPELRVDHYLRFAGGIRGLTGAALAGAIDAAIERFQLESVAQRPIGNLSKGFQQRVSLAQAFLHAPSLLIVDEPTSGLDPLQRAEVHESLASLRGKCTVLLCTHDLAEVRELTQRVAVLSQGHLVRCGETEKVLSGNDPLALFRGDISTGATQ
jgi:ABC-2 type transport system ATP-binding protein